MTPGPIGAAAPPEGYRPAGYTTFMGLTDGKNQVFGQPFTGSMFFYDVFGLFVFNIWVRNSGGGGISASSGTGVRPRRSGSRSWPSAPRTPGPGSSGTMVGNFMLPALILSRLLAR